MSKENQVMEEEKQLSNIHPLNLKHLIHNSSHNFSNPSSPNKNFLKSSPSLTSDPSISSQASKFSKNSKASKISDCPQPAVKTSKSKIPPKAKPVIGPVERGAKRDKQRQKLK